MKPLKASETYMAERLRERYLYAYPGIGQHQEQSPDPQPEGSPVGAGSRSGPRKIPIHFCKGCGKACFGKRKANAHCAKSPNTPRESRAVNNAGERTEGKS